MFASDRTSNAAIPSTLNVIGSAAAVPRALPARQDPTPTLKQTISLRRCDDEPALEYGCVDWFLYEGQRPQ